MVNDIRLKNFRSYNDSAFEFSQSVNIIVGPNGSGKTNLLEAILFISRGSSYRAKDSDLVTFNKSWSRLDAHTTSGSIRVVKLTPEEHPAKIYEIDGKEYKQLRLDKRLPVVLFEPEDLRLLSGGPDRRRDYLDNLIEQTVSGYASIIRQYQRALAQRNRLLKQTDTKLSTQLFPWDVRLSQLAGQIVSLRSRLVRKIDSLAEDIYHEISEDKTKIQISYGSSFKEDSYETSLLSQLQDTVEQDKLRGFTGSGPHREDMIVEYNGSPVHLVASRGESRSIIIALKTIELKLMEDATGQKPILLLDDIFSELDGKRRHKLTDSLSDYQSFVTTTDADMVIRQRTKGSQVIPMTRQV